MDAARTGDIATLSRSPELVKSRHEQATALHFAAINGQIEAEIVQMTSGAEVNATVITKKLMIPTMNILLP